MKAAGQSALRRLVFAGNRNNNAAQYQRRALSASARARMADEHPVESKAKDCAADEESKPAPSSCLPGNEANASPAEKDGAPKPADTNPQPSSEAKTPPPPSEASPETPPTESTKPRLATSFSRAARSRRAGASAAALEELPPPLTLPPSFYEKHVSLYESRPIGSPLTRMFPLEDADREKVLEFLDGEIEQEAVKPWEVKHWSERLAGRSLVDAVDEGEGRRDMKDVLEEVEGIVLGRTRGMHANALLQMLAVVYRDGMEERYVERLRRHYDEREEEIHSKVWRSGEPELSGRAQAWLAGVRGEAGISDREAGGGLFGSPLARRSEPEYPALMELLAAVRAELMAEKPGARLRELQRPVTVLSVLNQRGRSVAVRVVDDVATDLKADVVHLDAAMLGDLLGRHMGQNLHWCRGSVSMLGYAAAEMNGRTPPRADFDGEQEVGIHVSLPSKLRSYLSKESAETGIFDGRWEELKMMRALESLVASADAKRGVARPDRPLIIHLHDFVEITSLQDGIVTKLRHIVDRMWQRGRKVVLVGSSSSDVNKSSQWRDQLIELGRDGSHVIPFHSMVLHDQNMEKHDNVHENINNIKNMLEAMLGPSAKVAFYDKLSGSEGLLEAAVHRLSLRQVLQRELQTMTDPVAIAAVNERLECKSLSPMYDALAETLSQHVYDVQWVYRLASLIIGSRTPGPSTFTMADLQSAIDILSDSNKHWRLLSPGVRAPYFSPLFTPRASISSFMPSSPEDWTPGMPGPFGQGPASSGAATDYDQHEKKLLSGLINAKDIHTTFNDIIVPPETKESLIGLTSLSLVRPDAFSYGVLKTERIPGCLLYGPPGTGKTLLAKAVAKESGANMLEVSAASINDMWLGQSEKNVRALFSLARKMAPMAIFLDEADALLGARHNGPGRSSHRETITQFLREWDGLSDMRAFIMVATNRPFDLDEAVLRRLPRKILVDLPLVKERENILRVMLREETLGENVDLAKLAVETDLYSGSDLKNLCVSAAMEAVREEVRQKEKWEGEEPYVFPERRVLTRAHFEKGMREISASISEDMESLKAIRKFDAQYGDAGRKRKGRKGMGFEVVEEKRGSEGARVRQAV